MGLVVDISQQKWIQGQLLHRTKELESSEQKYRSFADLYPLGIVSTDPDGYVQWENDSWYNFYGFKKGETKDHEPWLLFIHPGDHQKATDYMNDLRTQKGPWTVELRLKKKYNIYEGDRVLGERCLGARYGHVRLE